MKSSTSVSSSSASDLAEQRRHDGLDRRHLRRDGLLAPASRHLAAHVIGQASDGDVIQPAARIVGNAGRGPLRRRRDQRFLHRILRGGEVVVPTRDGAEHLRRELAQQVPDGASRRHAGVTRLRAARS